MPDTAFLVDRADGILTLSFNRPEAGNAIPPAAVAPLIELFASINDDASVRAVIVRGEGKHFSAGGDVQGFARSLAQPVEERRADFAARLGRVTMMVEHYLAIEVPVIAACQGAVAGGGLMYALGADYVFADAGAMFIFAHQRVGLVPDTGVSYLLPRVVGERSALDLTLRAGRIGADEARRIGIVNQIAADGALDAEARALAEKLRHGPSGVMRAAKRLIRASASSSLSDHLSAERDAIVRCVGEAPFEEGVRAFLDKRSPDFSQM